MQEKIEQVIREKLFLWNEPDDPKEWILDGFEGAAAEIAKLITAEIATLFERKGLLERIEKAVEIAFKYGGINGGHHKMWVIDQMLRCLLADQYSAWREEYEEDGEYEWVEGIPP